MRKFKQSIRLRLTLFFVAVTTLALSIGIYARQQLSNDLESQFASVKQGVTDRLAVNMSGALWNFDNVLIDKLLLPKSARRRFERFLYRTRVFPLWLVLSRAVTANSSRRWITRELRVKRCEPRYTMASRSLAEALNR